ncbi:MAG TPA: hypothetical protein VIL79_11490 [Thermoleophilia bacterium]
MGCCLLVGILAASPRLILLGMWLFTNYLAQASIAFVWGFIGFLFAPCTTMAYAIAQNSFGGLSGWGTVVFALGIVLDIFVYYGGGRSRTRYAHD